MSAPDERTIRQRFAALGLVDADVDVNVRRLLERCETVAQPMGPANVPITPEGLELFRCDSFRLRDDLRRLLRRYGRHLNNCDEMKHPAQGPPFDCTCGLDQAVLL